MQWREKVLFFPSSFKDLGLYFKNPCMKTKRARLCCTWEVEEAVQKFKTILDCVRFCFKTAAIKRSRIRIRLLKNNVISNQRVRQCLQTLNKSYYQPGILWPNILQQANGLLHDWFGNSFYIVIALYIAHKLNKTYNITIWWPESQETNIILSFILM